MSMISLYLLLVLCLSIIPLKRAGYLRLQKQMLTLLSNETSTDSPSSPQTELPITTTNPTISPSIINSRTTSLPTNVPMFIPTVGPTFTPTILSTVQTYAPTIDSKTVAPTSLPTPLSTITVTTITPTSQPTSQSVITLSPTATGTVTMNKPSTVSSGSTQAPTIHNKKKHHKIPTLSPTTSSDTSNTSNDSNINSGNTNDADDDNNNSNTAVTDSPTTTPVVVSTLVTTAPSSTTTTENNTKSTDNSTIITTQPTVNTVATTEVTLSPTILVTTHKDINNKFPPIINDNTDTTTTTTTINTDKNNNSNKYPEGSLHLGKSENDDIILGDKDQHDLFNILIIFGILFFLLVLYFTRGLLYKACSICTTFSSMTGPYHLVNTHEDDAHSTTGRRASARDLELEQFERMAGIHHYTTLPTPPVPQSGSTSMSAGIRNSLKTIHNSAMNNIFKPMSGPSLTRQSTSIQDDYDDLDSYDPVHPNSSPNKNQDSTNNTYNHTSNNSNSSGSYNQNHMSNNNSQYGLSAQITNINLSKKQLAQQATTSKQPVYKTRSAINTEKNNNNKIQFFDEDDDEDEDNEVFDFKKDVKSRSNTVNVAPKKTSGLKHLHRRS